ncbi:MAG: tripartite tricarboxylate transporter substrate binding protein [Proteobacteria bacterium]|nr:tripartite tricarboxylate transporter substrate binding protein [Pseudomonadota bacterium]
MIAGVKQVARVQAALIYGTLALTAAPIVAFAQTDAYPSRPVTLIVPFPPGGSSDIVMRLVGRRVSESIKQTIVIENRPGGAGNVAAMAIKNAPPDGYLLMMGHAGTHAINPSLYADLKFDPIKDFAPITALISFNNILVVPQSSPARSVAELVAYGKSKPEGLNYGSQGVGTSGHLLGELFAHHAGVKLTHVPYRGIAPAVTDTVAGRMDMLFSSYLSAAGNIESGKLRMLAIAGTQRHPRIPDIVTMPEAGFPEVQMQQWFGLFAPANTPAPIIAKLNEEFVKALQSDELKNRVLPQVASLIPGTPEDLSQLVARDIVRLGKVVRESGARVQ